MGTICTNDIVQYQYNYQSSEELSENSVVIMYDPIVSTKGVLVLKAFRLSDAFLELKRTKANQFIRPADILEELPLKIRNVGHVSAFLRSLQDAPQVRQFINKSFSFFVLQQLAFFLKSNSVYDIRVLIS